jgi:PAS domain S-box-containing protein
MKILLVDDSKEDAELILEMLDVSRDKHDIRRAERLSAVLTLIEEDTFDVVLLDIALPDSVGLEALTRIRAQTPELPIIVLTGLSDEALAVNAISLGAQDYLVKWSFDADSLNRAIRYSISRHRVETDRKKLTDAVPALLSYVDANYHYRSVNHTYELWLGLKQGDIIGRHVREVLGEAVWEQVRNYMERALRGEQVSYEQELSELLHQRATPQWAHVSFTPDFDDKGEVRGFVVLVQDISSNKRAEKERELAVDFLRLVNESSNKKDMIQAAVTFFRQHSGCGAVGMRLHEEDDYPYYEVRGFPAEFVLAENSLCARSDTGEVIRDSAGNPVLDCMCGNIISGRFDPSKPFFTEGGSFWSNNTTELLASTTEADRQARTRNRCNGEGYESVALIALRVGEDRLGLLQLNDRRKDRFSPEDIALWERLAGYLAVALAKFQAEESLRGSEELYHSLFDNMLNGLAYCRMLYSQDQPSDFIYLAVNDAFATLTGLKDVVGRKVTDVIPGIREADPELFRIYSRVALSGKPERFETYVAALRMWFSISVYSPKKEHFVAVFDVITERKTHEREIERLNKLYATLSGINKAVVRVKSREELFRVICRTTAEHAGFKLVWIGWYDTESHTVKPVGRAGDKQDYLDKIKVYADDRPEGHGPVGTCIREDSPCIFNDFQNNELSAPWHKTAVAHGLRAVAAFPIHLDKEVCGAFAVYDVEADAFRDKEVALLEEAAIDISFALNNLDREARKKDAEAALRQSEERFRLAMDATSDGLWEWNVATDQSYYSPSYFTMLGYEGIEFPDTSAVWTDLIHPDDRANALSVNQGCIENRHDNFRTEFRMRAKDGTWRWILGRGKAVMRNADGRALLMVGTHVDITDRKKAEEKIVNAKREWEDTFDAITEIIFLHDSDGRIIRANRAYEQMAGMSLAELIGRPYYKVFPRTDSCGKLCNNAMRSGLSIVEEITIDSIGKTFSVRMYPKLDDKGTYLYSVHVMLDITERKKVIEAEIMKETAEAANKAKSDFLAGMSHEFRTPLNAVIGFSELMATGLGGPLTDQQKEYVADIFSSGQHLLSLVNDILDLSKVEAGKMELQMNEFNIKKLIETCIALFKEKAYKHDLQVTFEIAKGLDTMIGDERKIRQVLFNLLGNAVKFTPNGGRIHVVVALTDDKAFLQYSVSDTGIGIPPEDQNKLFKPFQQIDTRLTRKYKGTGLGLSLCKQLVELHGGRIWVESETAKGSNFVFVIPSCPGA